MRILVATRDLVVSFDSADGKAVESVGLEDVQPTCLAVDSRRTGRVWCGTTASGVYRSEDGGASWWPSGLDGEMIMSVAASPVEEGAEGSVVYAGTEPSALYRSEDGGATWARSTGLLELRSSSEWSFPPRPETHHVRWIACHPRDPGRLYLAIEAGALVTTPDAGATWRDREPGGPHDTHELAIHPERPDGLRVAAGDGYYESEDGGRRWRSPEDGLDVTYLRSVAIDPGDPDVVVVSGASGAHDAYMAGRSDGRIYRREGAEPWRRVTEGWPDPPDTVAPLLVPGREPGELWAASDLGSHRSGDGGRTWEPVGTFDSTPPWIRGLALVG